MSASEVVGFTATVITCVQVTTQARLAVSSRSVAGVAGLTWVLALVQSVGLLVYSIDRRLSAAILVNGYVGLACIAIVVVLVVRGEAGSRVVLAGATAIAGAAIAIAARAGGPALLGTVGAAAAIFVWIPQAVRSARTRSPDGLSIGFVLAGLTSSALWLAYAALESEWRLGVAPAAALVSMVVTGAQSNVARRRSR